MFSEKFGFEVYQARGITYYDAVHSKISNKKNKGKYFGYSLGWGYCSFRDRSKIKALRCIDVGKYDFEDIGIAADETNRQKQLSTYKRSILTEFAITEKQAFEICKKHNMLSPHYETNKRDGCAICPNARRDELINYIADYPEAIQVLKEIDDFCMKNHNIKRAANGNVITPYRNFETFMDRINYKSEIL